MTLSESDLGFLRGVQACVLAAQLEMKEWKTLAENLESDRAKAVAVCAAMAFANFSRRMNDSLVESLRYAEGAATESKDMS